MVDLQNARCAILHPKRMARKAERLMRALARSLTCQEIQYEVLRDATSVNNFDVLFLYGWGGRVQQNAVQTFKGHYIAFDLGYWNRYSPQLHRAWRVSIDGFHCPRLIMRGEAPNARRLLKDNIEASPDIKKFDGPIMLVGNAPKSRSVGAEGWSMQMSRKLRREFPGRQIWYRPKPERPKEAHVSYDKVLTGPLDFRDVSLVVCRHSNVAVDACRAGVPVVCEDGAAAGIYPRKLRDWEQQPTQQQRQEFLARVAYWQWSMHEIEHGKTFWEWLEGQLVKL